MESTVNFHSLRMCALEFIIAYLGSCISMEVSKDYFYYFYFGGAIFFSLKEKEVWYVVFSSSFSLTI